MRCQRLNLWPGRRTGSSCPCPKKSQVKQGTAQSGSSRGRGAGVHLGATRRRLLDRRGSAQNAGRCNAGTQASHLPLLTRSSHVNIQIGLRAESRYHVRAIRVRQEPHAPRTRHCPFEPTCAAAGAGGDYGAAGGAARCRAALAPLQLRHWRGAIRLRLPGQLYSMYNNVALQCLQCFHGEKQTI